MKDNASEGFLSRWSRRKVQERQGEAAPVPSSPTQEAPPQALQMPAATAVPSASMPSVVPPSPAAAPVERPAPPTLDEVASLTPASDFRRFVAPDASPEVKNAALKKLFADPQFNVMDGLDTYIDDYGRPDPIPAAMLRQLVQARGLGLFDDPQPGGPDDAGASPDSQAVPPPAQSLPEPTEVIPDDQDPAVRLQSHDAAGPNGDPDGTGQDPGRQR